MKTFAKVLVVSLLVVLVVGAVALKNRKVGAPDSALASAPAPNTSSLPRLLELGADKCIPCKAMAPILEQLKTEYAGRLNVEFVDVWKDPEASKLHAVEIIPTQIFFDAQGKELFRHVGFYAKEDILGKWQELGVDLGREAAGPIAREAPVHPETASERK